MYTPIRFREDDLAKLHAFIETHSFATLVTAESGDRTASHLPLLLDRMGSSRGRLIGRMGTWLRQTNNGRMQPSWSVNAAERAFIDGAARLDRGVHDRHRKNGRQMEALPALFSRATAESNPSALKQEGEKTEKRSPT